MDEDLIMNNDTPSTLIADTYNTLCDMVAGKIRAYVLREPEGVLGLFTGGTPVGVYERLVLWQRRDGLDFSGITCFNLDERYPIEPDAPQSFTRFMKEQFFDHVKVREWNIPDGRKRNYQKITDDCAAYEEKIRQAGIQIRSGYYCLFRRHGAGTAYVQRRPEGDVAHRFSFCHG